MILCDPGSSFYPSVSQVELTQSASTPQSSPNLRQRPSLLRCAQRGWRPPSTSVQSLCGWMVDACCDCFVPFHFFALVVLVGTGSIMVLMVIRRFWRMVAWQGAQGEQHGPAEDRKFFVANVQLGEVNFTVVNYAGDLLGGMQLGSQVFSLESDVLHDMSTHINGRNPAENIGQGTLHMIQDAGRMGNGHSEAHVCPIPGLVSCPAMSNLRELSQVQHRGRPWRSTHMAWASP